MKTITRNYYVANDGTEFESKNECIAHEKLMEKVKVRMDVLPKRPNTCNFLNGHGYIQHDEKTFLNVRKQFHKLACKILGINYPIDSYNFWRTLDDSESPLNSNSTGQRFLNTNTNSFREYGQLYFVTHENELTENKQINKR